MSRSWGGKYLDYDIADYICWYYENELKKPVDVYRLNYTMFYILGMYASDYEEKLFTGECEVWKYGFMFPSIYWLPPFLSKEPNEVIIGVVPRKEFLKELEDDIRMLIEQVCDEMSFLKLSEIRNDMRSMDCYKDNYLESFKDKDRICIYQTVEWKEIHKEFCCR